jgi:hypothetical protein
MASGTVNSARGRGKNATRKARLLSIRKKFSATLVQVGKEQGLDTPEKLAECMGLTGRALLNWRKNKQRIDFELVAYCEPLCVPFFDRLAEVMREGS